MKKQWKRVLLILLAYAGISLELTSHGEGTGLHQTVLNLIASFRGFSLERALLIPGLYLLFQRAENVPRQERRWTVLLPALFFALNMPLGFAFAAEGSWDMLWGLRDGQLLKTAWVVLGWYIIFDRGLRLIYHFLDTVTVSGAPEDLRPGKGFHPARWYLRMLRRHSFLTPFLSLCVLYLPHILISYPAMFMGDTWSIIVQGYGELQNTGVDYLSAENILRPGVFLNQHHPVFYTLALHGFLRLGDGLFHSLNLGLFLFCLAQAALMLSAFAYGISTLTRCRVRPGFAAALVLYAFLQPQAHDFLMLVTKDGSYTACFIFLLSTLFRRKKEEASGKTLAALCLAGAGMILLRNEGRYVVLIAGVLASLMDGQHRKRTLALTLAAAVFSLGVYQGLYPLLGYTGGSVREALSIPFQQTARIVRDVPENISSEEREAIQGVLDFDALAESYDPNEADPVKALYRQAAEGKELLTYFRAWAGLLLRHPDICLQATYGNYYQYFYPADVRMNYYGYGWSDRICGLTNEHMEPVGKSFSLPEWNLRYRLISDSVVEAGLLQVPVLSAMMTPALYTWALLILMAWALGRKKRGRREMLVLCVIPALLLLVQFAGPTNGNYGRYMLPITASLPMLAGMLLMLRRE